MTIAIVPTLPENPDIKPENHINNASLLDNPAFLENIKIEFYIPADSNMKLA